ncbi:class I SAM-dependent methyltransferase [bacterium]|nr:class I SAM-dependent methyltransferase [bacterium]
MDYLKINKALWNKKTQSHVNSEFYDQDTFLKGRNSLNDIELELLEDVRGKSILHLQCHFGQDSMSLQRMGAEVTGVDISDEAISKAQEIATELGLNTKFICTDVYNLPNVLDQKFDVVFTSYGTIGWLPDIKKWAAVVQHFIKHGGTFVMADFHPAMWMFDNDFNYVQYHYHNADPIVEQEEGTYADKNASIDLKSVGWNHGMAEIIGALLEEGLTLEKFKEYNYSPYNCVNGMVEHQPGKFIIEKMSDKLPLVYAIKASK